MFTRLLVCALALTGAPVLHGAEADPHAAAAMTILRAHCFSCHNDEKKRGQLDLTSREAALKGVHRLLKPGGLFISKTPCLKEMNPILRVAVPVRQVFGQAPYVAIFAAEELEGEIAAAGFEIVEQARHASRSKDARPFLVTRKA